MEWWWWWIYLCMECDNKRTKPSTWPTFRTFSTSKRRGHCWSNDVIFHLVFHTFSFINLQELTLVFPLRFDHLRPQNLLMLSFRVDFFHFKTKQKLKIIHTINFIEIFDNISYGNSQLILLEMLWFGIQNMPYFYVNSMCHLWYEKVVWSGVKWCEVVWSGVKWREVDIIVVSNSHQTSHFYISPATHTIDIMGKRHSLGWWAFIYFCYFEKERFWRCLACFVLVLSCLVLFCSCLILSCLILVLSCFVLVLSCFVLVLSCVLPLLCRIYIPIDWNNFISKKI
jgi:hypothetical protein